MTNKYECDVCGHLYDEEKEKKTFKEEPDDWACPVCASDKTQFKPKDETKPAGITAKENASETDKYLSQWQRTSDDFELHMADIHAMAETGKGFGNYLMVLGVIETVALFVMVFILMAAGKM